MRFITNHKEFYGLLEKANLTFEEPYVSDKISELYQEHTFSGNIHLVQQNFGSSDFYDDIRKLCLNENLYVVALDLNPIEYTFKRFVQMVQFFPEDDWRKYSEGMSKNHSPDEKIYHSIDLGYQFAIFSENLEWIMLLENAFYQVVRFFIKKDGKSLEDYYFMMHGKTMPKE